MIIFLRSLRDWVGHISRVYIKDANIIFDTHNVIINLYKFIFSDGNFGLYNADLSELYSIYAHELLKEDRIDESFAALENSYNHAKMLGELKDKYTAPFVDLVKINADKNLSEKRLSELLDLLKGDIFFTKINGDPRFTALVNRIEADV